MMVELKVKKGATYTTGLLCSDKHTYDMTANVQKDSNVDQDAAAQKPVSSGYHCSRSLGLNHTLSAPFLHVCVLLSDANHSTVQPADFIVATNVLPAI
jgi:hypothetical protein